MNKEIGKWFLDVAKYILTAVLLKNLFGNSDSAFVVIVAISAMVALFILGIYFLRDDEVEEQRKKHKEYGLAINFDFSNSYHVRNRYNYLFSCRE